MKWVWAVGITAGALTTTLVAAADPANEAVIHHESGEPAGPGAAPATVPAAPQSRELSRADGDDAELRADPAEKPLWYGWQTLALDGGLIVGGIVALHFAIDSDTRTGVVETLAWTPAVAYVVGGPTIHLIHKEPWRALGSLGLRTGLPALGGAMGVGVFATCPPPGGEYGNCGLGEFVVGVSVGVLAASLIDGGAVARKSAKPRGVALSLTPFISADGTGHELRLRGEF
jgi:hypothetical protein